MLNKTDRISDLKRQIAELPAGSISRKTINGINAMKFAGFSPIFCLDILINKMLHVKLLLLYDYHINIAQFHQVVKWDAIDKSPALSLCRLQKSKFR